MPPPGRLRCVPPYRPERGDEDVERVLEKHGRIYVVGRGRTVGIFTSEARARRQVEGVSNGHWRKAKSWDQATDNLGRGRAIPRSPSTPRTRHCRDAATHSSKPDDAATTYTTTRVSEGQAYSMPGFTASSATPRAFPVAATRAFPAASSTPPPKISASAFTATRRALPTLRAFLSTKNLGLSIDTFFPRPRSPLSNMDAVEAFSRMGISEPIVYESPPKQWVIKGVNIFFAQREEAVNYILTHQLQMPSGMVGSRNIRKLCAFARGQNKNTATNGEVGCGTDRAAYSAKVLKFALVLLSCTALDSLAAAAFAAKPFKVVLSSRMALHGLLNFGKQLVSDKLAKN
ncbi:hypothetical protein C8F04DRAFT_1279590 [Mycena alexandri]|uniref:Uncharacterized protein n=1 Tax=Mycena alexandri TaxID=1745969 RepID=A0AAD6RYI5_9AGAR|nr:hypothetical protein C8F04DRAFT_1279590 [Mycena alexandri]